MRNREPPAYELTLLRITLVLIRRFIGCGTGAVFLFFAAASPVPADGRIKADAAFGIFRLESDTRAAYGLQAAFRTPDVLFAGEFLQSGEHNYSFIRAARRLGHAYGLEFRSRETDLAWFPDPISGREVRMLTDFAIYRGALGFKGSEAAIALHHIRLKDGASQYGASVGQSMDRGRLCLAAEYGFYGTSEKRRLDAEHRPSSVLPVNFGSVRYMLEAEATYRLWQNAGMTWLLTARTEYLMAHPSVSDISPSRQDSMIMLIMRRGERAETGSFALDTPDPVGRSIVGNGVPPENRHEMASYLGTGIRLGENKLWDRRDVKGSIFSTAPILSYISQGRERSVRMEAGTTLRTNAKDSTTLSEGSYPYVNIEAHYDLGRSGQDFHAHGNAASQYGQGAAHLDAGGETKLSFEAQYIGSGIDHISTAEVQGGQYRRYLAAWWGPLSQNLLLHPNSRLQIGFVALPKGAIAARIGADLPILRDRVTAGISGEVTFGSADRTASASSRFSIQGIVGVINDSLVYVKYQHNSTLQPRPVQSDEILALHLLKPLR